MKKTLLAAVTISVAAFAYANTSPSDSSELVNQQCKISAESVSTLINASLKTPENRDLAQKTLNLMVDDKSSDVRSLEGKYCS